MASPPRQRFRFRAVRAPRTHPFAASVLATCRRRRLLGPGDRILVALSGGPDSTALLAALAALRDAGRLLEVHALHVDHGLRAGSAADGAFCDALCLRLRVPFDRVAVRVDPGNVQARARRARYRALREAAARLGANRIATGHTRADQAETVILRLLRGAGARGLAAIPPRRGPVVRPLIDRSRAEILAFLADAGLPFLEDPTNATPRFLRNRVRNEILPLLERLNPSLERALARTADLLREDERALEASARAAAPAPRPPPGEAASIEVERLRGEPLAVRRRVVRRLWRRVLGRAAGLGAGHVASVLALLRRRGPGRVALPGGVEARAAYGVLTVGLPVAASSPIVEVAVPGPGVYALPGRRARIEVALGPDGSAAVDWPLTLRSRRPGDRFRPEGGRGGKKLKSWLIDRKVPREERDRLVVLADRRGNVLWLPDLGARAAAPGLGFRLVREEA